MQRRCFQCGSVHLRSDIKGTELPHENIMIPLEWEYFVVYKKYTQFAIRQCKLHRATCRPSTTDRQTDSRRQQLGLTMTGVAGAAQVEGGTLDRTAPPASKALNESRPCAPRHLMSLVLSVGRKQYTLTGNYTTYIKIHFSYRSDTCDDTICGSRHTPVLAVANARRTNKQRIKPFPQTTEN